MKKLLVFLFLFVFSVSTLNVNAMVKTSYLTKEEISKELILLKHSLEKKEKGKSYISVIDGFISKSPVDKLKNVKKRVDKFLAGNNLKNGTTLLVIKYLKYKLDLALYNVSDNKVSTKEEKVKEVSISVVTSEEKAKVREEILKLQKNLLSSSKDLFYKIRKDLEDEMNVEQKGDMTLKLDLDYDKVGNIDYDFSLKDYIAKSNSFFQNSIEGDLKSDLNYDFKNGSGGILNLVTKYEQISKEGNLYIGLKNFHVSEKDNMEDIEKFLNILENIGEKDKFIRIPANAQTQKFYTFFKNINSSLISGEFGEIQTNPMLETYGKSGDKYFLRPTKFACEKYKELEKVFDPINGTSCSDSQYKKMLEASKKMGDLYISFSSEITKLGLKFENFSIDLDSYIVYNSDKIKEISFYVSPKDKNFAGEHVSFKYLDGKSLDFSFLVGGASLEFKGILDSNNNFSSISSSYKKDKSAINFNLKNNNISGDIYLINKGYEYENGEWQQAETSKVVGKIYGSTKSDNSLEKLNITYEGIDLKTNKEFFKGGFNFEENYINFSLDTINEGNKINFSLSFNYDENYFPINGNFKLYIFSKDHTYNEETFDIVYTSDFKKVFSMDIDISNREISGETIIPNFLTIDHNGWISNERFNFENNITGNKKLIDFWNLQNKDDVKSINGVFNISAEYSNNREDAEIVSYFMFGTKEVFRLEFKNDSKKHFKDEIIIEAPEKYIDIQDLQK